MIDEDDTRGGGSSGHSRSASSSAAVTSSGNAPPPLHHGMDTGGIILVLPLTALLGPGVGGGFVVARILRYRRRVQHPLVVFVRLIPLLQHWVAILERVSVNPLQSATTATNTNPKSVSEIAAQLCLPHPRLGGTVLHVAAWKVPPALAVMMIRLMPKDSREMRVLQSIRDGEGNTPLHLCAGNLDCREDAGGDNKNGEGGGIDYLAVLKEIVASAPSKAWLVQNSEGDTPLHMLVSSPLCNAEWRSLSSNNNNNAASSARAKLAQEAITLALSTRHV
ncbi:hypothetical protein ACHAXR_007924 [Thalassiosira sp. AJA248-18]